MPLRHLPNSLQKCCIWSLADNWDLICYACPSQTEMVSLIESNDYLNTHGPFVKMPSSFLVDLLEVIGERRSLTRKFLHLLILEQLETLNLSFGTGEIHYGFEFLLRCKRLRELNLSYLRHVEPRQLLSIIPSLSSIVCLNLQMTCTIDQVLEAIGNCCPQIQDLNLTSTLVSDDGIFRMSGEKQNDGLKRCQKLQRLIVTETRVSWVGALCALKCFPQIREFDFDKVFQVFEHLDPESEAVLELPKFKLRSLYSVSPCIRADSVDAAAKLCPNVEVLSVMNAWIGNEMLYKFMQFENVRSVTIVNNEGMTLDYDEGVLPFLQVCGPQLENLILNKFETVNLTSLGGSCPRLRKMALCSIGSYEPKGSVPVKGLFRCLTALELWFDDRTEFTSKYTLLQLLRDSVHISKLLVKKSDDFTLETLREIWRFNPMSKLSRVTVEECHSMTGEVMDELLEMQNELTLFRIWSCSRITREQYQIRQRFIAENNLDVYLEWFA